MNNQNQDYQKQNGKQSFLGKKQTQEGDSVYGRIPPQAVDLEAAVLGAILLEKDRLMEVMDIIPYPECFYDARHQVVYEAIMRQEQSGMPVDLLTISATLSKTGKLKEAGDAYYLTLLTMNVVSSAHVEDHARIVMEKYMARELIKTSGQLISNAYDVDDIFDLIDYAEQRIMDISSATVKHAYKSAQELANEARRTAFEAATRPDGVLGVDTGFYYLNHITNGWQPKSLIIVAARPAVGKTAFALNLAYHGQMSGKGIGIFSLEMGSVDLSQRILSFISGIPHDIIKTGKFEEHEQIEYDKALKLYASFNIHVDDNFSLSLLELRSKARKMKRKHDIGLLIIDYLQLMNAGKSGKGGNREQEVAAISRGLKGLAKELDIPVIALSQINRAAETRGENTVPKLSDLRESGAIEQDADMVMFLYGPAPGEKTEGGEIIQETSIPRFIYIAKQRSGSTGTVALTFDSTIQKFKDKDESGRYSNPNAGFQNARQNLPIWEDNPF